jgi:hypothetical protein
MCISLVVFTYMSRHFDKWNFDLVKLVLSCMNFKQFETRSCATISTHLQQLLKV